MCVPVDWHYEWRLVCICQIYHQAAWLHARCLNNKHNVFFVAEKACRNLAVLISNCDFLGKKLKFCANNTFGVTKMTNSGVWATLALFLEDSVLTQSKCIHRSRGASEMCLLTVTAKLIGQQPDSGNHLWWPGYDSVRYQQWPDGQGTHWQWTEQGQR